MKIKFNKTEIEKISQKLLNKILKIKNKGARVIAISGDLGAGKTTLTQELGKILGIKTKIVSPTFVIMKTYKIKSNSVYYNEFKKLVHIDAYRLDSHSDLMKLGWKELQNDKDNLIIIEWPERVAKCLGANICSVKLEHIDNETRVFEF